MSDSSLDPTLRERVRQQYPDGIAEKSYRPSLGVVANLEVARAPADEARDEKAIVARADKQMRALGFRVIGFSQPRATKQTPGIPDRLYFHRARSVAVWWEAKTETGVQSPAQRDFQVDCVACGWPYVLGTDRALYDWLVTHRLAAWQGEHLVSRAS